MYARVRKSKDGISKMVWHPEPGDLPVTGTSSDGRYTTFSSDGKHHFTARNIHEDEAYWLAAILPCIIGACAAWIALGGSRDQASIGPLFLLSMFGVGLLAVSIREEAVAWKEMLFIAATIALLESGKDTRTVWFAVIAYGFLLIRYAWLWRERAVWEPFVFLALFCGTVAAHRGGILPDLFATIALIGIMAGSFVGLMTVLGSGWAYSRGINSITE